MSNSNKDVKEQKGVGVFDFFCIGFGTIVGVGWALSVNGWMAKCGGPLPAAVGYLAVLVLLIPVALAYCELVPMLPVAGGGAAYCYKVFGEKAALISGWSIFGGMCTMLPWEAIYCTDILSLLIPGLKDGDPLYTLAGTGIYPASIVLGIIFSCIFFAVNWRGVTSSAAMQRFFTVLLICGGVVAIVASLFKFDPANLQPIYENVNGASHKGFFGGMLAILLSAPFFVSGFETIPQAVEESGGDLKSVGKTVIMVVSFACIFYAILLITLGAAMPWQEFVGVESPAASNLFLSVFGGGVGRVLFIIVLISAICGMLTTWNGFFMASSLLMMSLARAYIIPHVFAKQHPKYRTPSNAIIFLFIISLIGPFLGMGLIDPLTSFSGAGFLISWGLTAVCAARLRKTEPNMHRPYKMPGGAITGWLGGIFMFAIFILLFIPGNPAFMGTLACVLYVIWMAIGVVLYLATGPQRKAVPESTRASAFFSHAAAGQEEGGN